MIPSTFSHRIHVLWKSEVSSSIICKKSVYFSNFTVASITRSMEASTIGSGTKLSAGWEIIRKIIHRAKAYCWFLSILDFLEFQKSAFSSVLPLSLWQNSLNFAGTLKCLSVIGGSRKFSDAFWYSVQFIADLVDKDSSVATWDLIGNRMLAIIILLPGFRSVLLHLTKSLFCLYLSGNNFMVMLVLLW